MKSLIGGGLIAIVIGMLLNAGQAILQVVVVYYLLKFIGVPGIVLTCFVGLVALEAFLLFLVISLIIFGVLNRDRITKSLFARLGV